MHKIIPLILLLIINDANAWIPPHANIIPLLGKSSPPTRISRRQAQSVGVIRHSIPLAAVNNQQELGNIYRPNFSFPLLNIIKKKVKKAVKVFAMTLSLVWILLAGNIANATSGSGGRMGGSFRPSTIVSNPFGTDMSFPSTGRRPMITRYSNTRLRSAPKTSAQSISHEGSTIVVGPKAYAIPLALYGSMFYVNSKNMKNRGRGISVMKLSLAFDIDDRDAPGNILQKLKLYSSTFKTDSRKEVQKMVTEVCSDLLRQQSNIFAASSSYEHHKQVNDAERCFNNLSVQERSKFEKETVSNFEGRYDAEEEKIETDHKASTLAIVTIILSIEGCKTKPRTRVNSWQDIWNILSILNNEMMTDDCLLGAEVLWTPEKRSDVLTRKDVVADYPDLRIM